MKHVLPTLVALLLATLPSLPAHATSVTPFQAEYSARYKGIPASAQASLRKQGDNWMYLMTVGNAAASMSQATVFAIRGDLFIPLGGSDRTSYLGQQRAVTTRYGWAGDRQVRWTGDVKPSRAGPVALQRGDIDGLLLQLALVRDHGQQRANSSYRVIENGRARPGNFRRAGTEQVTVGKRAVTATRYVQSDRGKTTTVWIADGIPAPVRLTQQEDGKETVRLTMNSWR